ncbi:hypothetical protein J7T55_001585 [Diaporthe amygdali]|uniref:uncharacterized protein n=1 Tax=Phomopsis amygdali TaxID=1214568 RepID=UPI0022FE3968|nr:uncharacterized protein J7T55_001585 [Diaporthe amygdali]KAJ0115175.1 hypothetical protein J7T55_001585 [Diaporthe amygdali]
MAIQDHHQRPLIRLLISVQISCRLCGHFIAGRGPWGLMTMLWEHQVQQPLIILAAVIMISGLAIDPFAQQLIRPFDCSAPLDHHIATLPRTNQIDNYFSSGDEGEILTHTLRSALVAGLFSSGNEIPFECSTGNCTFSELYNTLGICSACEDLSSKTVVESKRRNPSLNFDTQNITTYFSSGDGSRYWGVQGEQLNTSFFGSFYDRPTDVARMDIRSLPVDDFLLRVDILVGKTTYSDDSRLISTGQNITGCDTAEASNTWACRGYGAASCTLQPCIRTYRAKIEAGFLMEQLVSQSPDIRWGSPRDLYYHGLLDTKCMSIQEVAFLETRGYELHNTTRWIPFYGDPSNNNMTTYDVSSDWVSNVESLLRHKCLHLISRWFISKVGYGNGRGPSAHDPAASQFVGTVRGLMWDTNESDEDILNVFGGPEVLQNIYNYGKVDFERIQSVFKNISDSLTTFIRTHGNTSYSQPARGQVQHYATCLGVQWPWITLPAGIAMLLILFLILVAENTRKRETPVWKASPLPWILGSGLRNNDSPLGSERVIKSAVTLAGMEDESRQILIALSDGTAPTIGMTHMRDHNLQITKA